MQSKTVNHLVSTNADDEILKAESSDEQQRITKRKHKNETKSKTLSPKFKNQKILKRQN